MGKGGGGGWRQVNLYPYKKGGGKSELLPLQKRGKKRLWPCSREGHKKC